MEVGLGPNEGCSAKEKKAVYIVSEVSGVDINVDACTLKVY
jgi:hypothetical protein